MRTTATRRIAARTSTREDETKVQACHLLPVLKDDHKDAIKDYQRDQPSCNDAHVEAVQKSNSELDASVTKGTEIRQKQHAEFVVSIADAVVLIKLAVNGLSGFYAPRLHEAASKAEFGSADRVYVNTEGGTTTAAQGALVQMKCERRDAELLRAEATVLASAAEVDVKAASTSDAENSDRAANIGALTMTALAFDRRRRLLGEVDALDSHKEGRQTSIESTKQLRSVMGGVEGIEERVLLSRAETLRCAIHRPLRRSTTCGIPRCSCADVRKSARSKRERHASCCTEFPMRRKSNVKATRAVVTRTFNCTGKTAANMKS